MSDSPPPSPLPDNFAGIMRLFPLPNLVMFPHVIQPLHIYEPRYRDMLEDAVADDQLIAMAHLEPGWEPYYDQQPAVFPFVCIGRIINHVRLPDGKYNLLLMGMHRAKIVRELPLEHLYRRAEVELLKDIYPPTFAQSRAHARRRLLAAFRDFIPPSATVEKQIQQLLDEDISLGVLTDMVAHTMSLPEAVKLNLLSQCDVDCRLQMLLDHFESLSGSKPASSPPTPPKFPPPFSAN